MAHKIPATVITGFLGAGKTTLIRNLLADAGGRRIALIINEFGDLGVDGDVLRACAGTACREEDIVELTNGCICCTVADDFIPTMTKLLERDEKPDHIVIETSGLALPQPLVAAFNWPGIREQVTVDGVVTVIDTAAVAAGRFADDEARVAAQRAADDSLDHDNPLEELFEDQIRAADLIVLNKADLVDAAALDGVRMQVEREAGRKLPILTAEGGRLPADVLIGLQSGTESLIAGRRSHHEIHHADGHEHDHEDFDSFRVDLGAVPSREALEDALRTVIARYDILRLKGFASIEGKPMRLQVQAVGNRIDSYFDRPAGQDEGTRLVVIGLHDRLDDDARKAITAHLETLTTRAAA
ncbi:cobalamin biosynthesis protein CobW [Aureimonas sp. OT7]|uniref:cobalamin biosynthesis protein CobW n=1 Tax=Aureimonas TaxID=414371 RepID=UPI001786D73A|nr:MULTISPECIES: cobalamin biosynthesis protein CobW [Aureimonas]QOG06649.1 cobalamin biosynthesis protein CobW [Aureimonas sp. OT7]